MKASDSTQACPRVSREVVFTTHTPVPAGHDRFHAGLIEEHLGPLREELGLSQDRLMGLGRENPRNHDEELFCMTVLGLRLSRRANAVSSLHGEVSRAMWTGLYSGQAGRCCSDRTHHQRRPCAIVAGSTDVSSIRSASRDRGGTRTAARPSIWEGIENVDDGELWETHLSLKSRMLEFVRRRAVEQAERRGESPVELQRLARC